MLLILSTFLCKARLADLLTSRSLSTTAVSYRTSVDNLWLWIAVLSFPKESFTLFNLSPVQTSLAVSLIATCYYAIKNVLHIIIHLSILRRLICETYLQRCKAELVSAELGTIIATVNQIVLAT